MAGGFDAPLRINVYQAVRTDAFALTYEEYWDGFARAVRRDRRDRHRRAAGPGHGRAAGAARADAGSARCG